MLDDELRPAAVGVVGKLARRGRIPLGYYKDDEKTAATFPAVDGVRWSVPGDHARIEEDAPFFDKIPGGKKGRRIARNGQLHVQRYESAPSMTHAGLHG